jgi:single-strand DNA-binding protein
MLNTVFLVGHLGKNLELKYSQSGTAFSNFTLATTQTTQDKQTGNKVDHTEWHNITCFGKLAELCSKYIQKGSKVLVEGSLRYETFEKDGVQRKVTKIVAKNVVFLDSKKQESETGQRFPKNDDNQNSYQPSKGLDELPDEIPF